MDKSWHGRHAVVLECNLPVAVVFMRASEMNGVRLTVRVTVRIDDGSCTLKKQVDFVPVTRCRIELLRYHRC